MTVKLIFNHEEIEADVGPSLFDFAEQRGIYVPTSCRKQGKCRECLVEVEEGMELLSPPSPEEAHLKDNFRLSCRCRVASESGVVRCHTLKRGAMRIEDDATGLPRRFESHQFDPAVARSGDRILLDGMEIDRSTGPIHGLAMDLGTTTVVIRLIDLETGKAIARTSFENPQRFGGSDVMARIQYDTDNPGRLLQRTLIGYLSHAVEDFPVDPKSIYEMVVVGNSTMRDVFFGLNVHSIGQKPYHSLTEREYREGKRDGTSLSMPARKLRLPIHPEARVYGMPLIGGHVGADAAACLLAIDLMNEDRLVALMDIGTNTELIVGNKDRVFAASCPAGPAFEGGKIACGMPGLEGAIEKIRLRDDGSVEFDVIGEKEAEGICGSGLVDLMSELIRTGRMNELGRFEDGPHRFEVDPEHEICFLEGDVNELAQAKGANVAGLHIVMNQYGIGFGDLDAFYLAGGFGRRLDLDAARRIGLIPNLPDDKIVQIGNAAVEGASIALLSKSRREALEAFLKKIRHVELETDPNFFDYFVQGCQFTPVETLSGEAAR